MADEAVTLTTKGRIAIITLNLPKKLNAMTQDRYYKLGTMLRQIAEMDDIYITVLTGKGRFFSSGADVQASRPGGSGDSEDPAEARRQILRSFVANNLDITRAFYTHPKILVTALNGPAVGLSAALIAISDFIYATPHAYLLTPFSSLGLVAEGGASSAFVRRLGIAKANEALIMSRRIPIEELVHVGFVNKVFQTKDKNDDEGFMKQVLEEIEDRLGDHLNQDSLLKIKALLRKPEREELDKQNYAEVFEGMDRFVRGIPQGEFKKIASGEKRHKL